MRVRYLTAALILYAAPLVIAQPPPDIVHHYRPGMIDGFQNWILNQQWPSSPRGLMRALVANGWMDSTRVQGQWHYRAVFPVKKVWFGSETFEAGFFTNNDLVFLAGRDRAVYEAGVAVDPDTVEWTTLLIRRSNLAVSRGNDRSTKPTKYARNQPPNIQNKGAFVSKAARQNGRIRPNPKGQGGPGGIGRQ